MAELKTRQALDALALDPPATVRELKKAGVALGCIDPATLTVDSRDVEHLRSRILQHRMEQGKGAPVFVAPSPPTGRPPRDPGLHRRRERPVRRDAPNAFRAP